MARIAPEELERLSQEVDLTALVRSKGIELNPNGNKDLVGRSPFTQEPEPGFVVSTDTNQWHCQSSGSKGGVVDFLMKHDGISLRHAVLLLKEQNPHLFGGSGVSKATVPKLEAPVSAEADDPILFNQVLQYYQERLQKSSAALDYLAIRGIGSEEALAKFEIGFADRTLGLRLPMRNRREGALIRERLQGLGLYRGSGHEHFNGCLVFPIRDASGTVRQVYGRKIGRQKSKLYHVSLPGEHGGIWNPEGLASPEVILTEGVIDALTFWVNGLRNVTCTCGEDGFNEDHLEAFKVRNTQRVYLAYDRDQAGELAAEKDAVRLQSIGIECFRVQFPPGQDANKYACSARSGARSLAAIIKRAEWLGKGRTISMVQPGEDRATEVDTSPAPLEDSGASTDARKSPWELQEKGDDLCMEIGDRQYRVRGLGRNSSFEVLKVNLRVWYNERYYLDVLDLYRARERGQFISAAAAETQLSVDLLKRDLGRILLALEGYQEQRIQEAMSPRSASFALSDPDKKAALELLKSPALLDRILEDFDRCGIVGEATNKLAGYLAAISRKLDRPLAIIVQSNSAAGKTALMDSILAMVPEEDRVKYSAMTGQSLYYIGDKDLQNKILAIVEEEGAEKACYALKLLQSEGELTIASTGKDDRGRMKTEEYHVEGPVMIFLTTTAIDIDEELLNRCLVLTVDESREQTQAIHRLQRDAETLEGLKRKLERDRILSVHRNAQRLLRQLHVVNPYAPQLTFLSDRTRTRRDHLKYLTLIRSIALLHQFQRPIQHRDGIRYIEVELSDIEAANRIAHELLGRSLDELSPQTRHLLTLLTRKVEEWSREKGLERDQCLFTRRQVRQWSGWSEFQVRTHLNRLTSLEYLLPHHGGRGQSFVYELLFDGDADSPRPQFFGLLDPDTLAGTMQASGTESPASSVDRPTSSPHGGVIEAGVSRPRDLWETAPAMSSGQFSPTPGEYEQAPECAQLAL